MAMPTQADFLKYADLQMAAEAIFTFNATVPGTNLVPGDISNGAMDPASLGRGNLHSSRFTTTEAAKLASEWVIVEHISNTTTGFSGTLFKNRFTDELVLSFRSTEFIDDAARDNEATNKLEIAEKGWALGQIADMEAWYQGLKGRIDRPVAVTGYSMGAHLATAFNLMHGTETLADGRRAVGQVVTFNGAGVGQVAGSNLAEVRNNLKAMVARFAELRARGDSDDGLPDQMQSEVGQTTYRALRTAMQAILDAGGNLMDGKAGLLAIVNGMVPAAGDPLTGAAKADYDLLWSALDRALSVAGYAAYTAGLKSAAPVGSIVPEKPATIPVMGPDGKLAVAAESLDYQMAYLLAANQYGASPLNLLGGAFAALGTLHPGVGAPLDNQWDVAGAEMSAPSAYYMVAHSQYRYGQEAQVFIEDQPLIRGQAFSSMVKASFADFAIRLLVDRYYYSDFGDTHSLVLIADTLAVENALLTLAPGGHNACRAEYLGNEWRITA